MAAVLGMHAWRHQIPLYPPLVVRLLAGVDQAAEADQAGQRFGEGRRHCDATPLRSPLESKLLGSAFESSRYERGGGKEAGSEYTRTRKNIARVVEEMAKEEINFP